MQKTTIVGKQGIGAKVLEAHVHPFKTATGNHVGAIVLTERFINFNPEFHPFLNDDFGTQMNQNIAFSGTPDLIHDGENNPGWTATAVAGDWDFADGTNAISGTASVSLTAGDNNDQATFGTASLAFSGFTAVTGELRLETYNENNNSINLQFLNNASNVGNSVDLNNFVDTGLLDSNQNFVISKDSFGIVTDDVDEISVTLTRIGGTKPTFRIDSFQIEETGTPAIFKATTPLGTRFHITEIRIRIEDAISAVLTDGSMPNIDPSAILGVSALSNGIVFARVQRGKTLFSVNLKDIGDFLATGSNMINITGDATNTGFTFVVMFPEAIILDGRPDSFLSFTINDNLSGLTRFTAAARGALEI